ncbi:MAG TPA: hypothetical protein VFC69_07935 [Dysgonamonadaceae bacterium]|nr:hypothetical protein [Dysgonamonadaceae bacterium]
METKELIKDERLTPTMDRVRGGRTQMFRENNPNDNSFISRENADVLLEHENKEMYAKLIDGKWYWVSGCNQCIGKPRGWGSYIECLEHDVCRVCHRPRSEFKGAVWGGSNGWTCKDCHEAERAERRRLAFEMLDGDEPDCSNTDTIICPHCGSEISNDDIYESQDVECPVCDEEFLLEIEYTATYSTATKGVRITS